MAKKPKNPPKVSLEKVTPALAKKWLSKRSPRRLRADVVKRFADDMRNGQWKDCINPIGFLKGGELLDGAHRLQAVVASGTTQKFIVISETAAIDLTRLSDAELTNLLDKVENEVAKRSTAI